LFGAAALGVLALSESSGVSPSENTAFFPALTMGFGGLLIPADLFGGMTQFGAGLSSSSISSLIAG